MVYNVNSLEGTIPYAFHSGHGIKNCLSCQPKNAPCPVHGFHMESIRKIAGSVKTSGDQMTNNRFESVVCHHPNAQTMMSTAQTMTYAPKQTRTDTHMHRNSCHHHENHQRPVRETRCHVAAGDVAPNDER